MDGASAVGRAPRRATPGGADPSSLGAGPAFGTNGRTTRVAKLVNSSCGTLSCSQDDFHDPPFSGGFLCVQAALLRTPVTLTGGTVGGNDCTGVMTRDFNAWIASGADPALARGVEVWAQFYSRDPGFAPPNNVNITEALDFVIHN